MARLRGRVQVRAPALLSEASPMQDDSDRLSRSAAGWRCWWSRPASSVTAMVRCRGASDAWALVFSQSWWSPATFPVRIVIGNSSAWRALATWIAQQW